MRRPVCSLLSGRGRVLGYLRVGLVLPDADGAHAAAAPVAGQSQERRSARAARDMQRIRAAAKGDELVERRIFTNLDNSGRGFWSLSLGNLHALVIPW